VHGALVGHRGGRCFDSARRDLAIPHNLIENNRKFSETNLVTGHYGLGTVDFLTVQKSPV
jgi:hypothetical protein